MNDNQKRFKRLGHYRITKLGKKIFVSPHIVVREKKINETNKQA